DLRRGLPREPLGIADHALHRLQVVVDVDQARALALELVRHAARAEDHDLEILRIGVNRLAQRLAELVAAARRRNRMLHGVHGEWDHFEIGRASCREREEYADGDESEGDASRADEDGEHMYVTE